MTIAELIAELVTLDPSTLVCIDTIACKPGLYPIADTLKPYAVDMGGEAYQTVVLRPSDWP